MVLKPRTPDPQLAPLQGVNSAVCSLWLQCLAPASVVILPPCSQVGGGFLVALKQSPNSTEAQGLSSLGSQITHNILSHTSQ